MDLWRLRQDVVVDSSSLSKANESRDYRIFEELGMWLIRKVRPMYSKENDTEPLTQNQNVNELKLDF